MKNKITSYINNIGISAKVSIGAIIIFFLFGFVSLVYLKNLTETRTDLSKVSVLSKNSSAILDINREISEIQRLVKVFSSTGGDSVLDKIKSTHKELTKKLVEVEALVESEKRADKIVDLREILASYGENIEELKLMYDRRDNLIQEVLPKKFIEGRDVINGLIEKKNSSYELEAYKLLQLWYRLHFNAKKFLETKEFSFKKALKIQAKSIIELTHKSNFPSSDKEKINYIVANYNSEFDHAVQANRVYLSLVNVVMAGGAIEFTNISKELRLNSVADLENILSKSEANFQQNKKIIIAILVLVGIFLGFISLFYQYNVAGEIKKISKTFKDFIEGDLEKDIPGLERGDEIGQLAKAADTFRTFSMRIQEERKKAETLTKSKSLFLATMSHEIRTPMNAIMSYTNLLLEDEKNSENIKMLKTVKSSGESLLDLINDILDFSKIESGKITLEENIFSLKKCIDSVIDLLKTKARIEGVTLEVSSDSEYPEFIRGDSSRLRQVLVNLVGNGIKFSKGKVVIRINESGRNESGEVDLNFHVVDDGIGIPQERQDSLFKEFSQIDASTTRKYGGTGLGLAICKGIVESMQGIIGVHSQEGSGADFFFTLRTTIEKAPQTQDEQEEYLSAINPESAAKLRILLAEDNVVNQMVAKKILSKMGHSIDIASNGIEAVEAVCTKQYDIVFMDQHMPEMDGVEAAVKIRGLDIQQPLIFALTASAFDEDKQRCINAGMDGFLAKPIIIKEVKAALEQAFNHIELGTAG